MLYAKIVLTEDIRRAIPLSGGWNNEWAKGTEFYIRQKEPGYGMVVWGGLDAGLGVRPENASILKIYGSLSEMLEAIEAG